MGLPLTTADGRTTFGDPIKVVDTADAEYDPIRLDGDTLLLQTDLDAPLGRIVSVDLGWAARGDVQFAEVVPETRATLTDAVAAADGLLLGYLDDAQGAVVHVGRDGSGAVEVDLPAGALVGLDGRAGREEAFAAVSTLTTPTASFRLVLPAHQGDPVAVEPLDLLPRAALDADRPGFVLRRHRATSADGTPVPYFLAVPDDGRDGPRPTLLYGYGGFKIPVGADYRPGWAAWLAAGGALAIANLRGGGEYGTAWYEDGRLANKQHVFDDVIAVGEDLIATGVTPADGLAVHGRSNGGLLAGAALTQRPDLFAAALPTVGVLDLLRFHKFTIGAAWMSDYGDPDTPEGFADAHAYSPLHRVRPGTAYPPTLVSTADHDDRVVPLHSFKFAAALQAAQGGDAPILLRVDTSAGHGAGKPLAKIASEWTDLLAFAAENTGLRPA
ncbi:prolyl oligopeptidase family serine peptidase [Propioniciclava coleopterorum]|uniref:prolyl oligopeptidase family serine peptidase n=1 Tax=Propioniciclava coleopterorum TaxID=2714937 RepID=UPI00202AFA86|nr:prolyl oligopeptidase family serine peptidase [Propioniciclava coleopterorum]